MKSKRVVYFAILNGLMVLFSLSNVFLKLAGEGIDGDLLKTVFSSGDFAAAVSALVDTVFSQGFFWYFVLAVATLGIYAIGWQQMLLRLPLSAAYANKAMVVVWTIVWDVLFFSYKLTAKGILGALIVVAGVVFYAVADAGEEQK